ncbi:MAG: helix-turn-helix transcriptional regulator [Solirubrobacterales bacterium]|nr:helix-turn-helix transcriptional regulator [Solirubrobacterales bacterium]
MTRGPQRTSRRRTEVTDVSVAVERGSGGELIREWRGRRHLSQLELAAEASISARHLSFVETGRSNPSRVLVLTLAEALAVPLRERNALLLAAGYAPAFSEASLEGEEMAPVRGALDTILAGHEPYPALIVDRQTVSTFGTAVDVTLDELSVESFYPADEPTQDYLRGN